MFQKIRNHHLETLLSKGNLLTHQDLIQRLLHFKVLTLIMYLHIKIILSTLFIDGIIYVVPIIVYTCINLLTKISLKFLFEHQNFIKNVPVNWNGQKWSTKMFRRYIRYPAYMNVTIMCFEQIHYLLHNVIYPGSMQTFLLFIDDVGIH